MRKRERSRTYPALVHTEFRVTGEVEIFPQDGGWYYLPVPIEITEDLEKLADRGLVPVTATMGNSTWDTSLLPKGDGTKFIALNAKVRGSEGIDLGDTITVKFRPRTH